MTKYGVKMFQELFQNKDFFEHDKLIQENYSKKDIETVNNALKNFG